MADEILTSMVAPDNQTTYVTRDGTPYRAEPVNNLVDVRPEHVTELTGRGFSSATVATVPPGGDVLVDQGW